MKPVPIKMLCSPWVAGFMLSAEDTDTELASLIRRLEGNDERGMFRPIPLEDVEAYKKGLQDTLGMLDGATVADEARAIVQDAEGARRALRLILKLTN